MKLPQILSVFVLLFLVVGLVRGLYLPLWETAGAEFDLLEGQVFRIARQQEIEKRAEEYEQTLAELPETLVTNKLYQQQSVSSSQAALQRDINQVVARSGLSLNSLQGLPSRQSDKFNQIGIRLDAIGDINQVSTLLSGLRSHSKLLRVSKAAIRTRRQEDQYGPAQLSVNVEVIAFAQK